MSINPFADILRPYFDWFSDIFENLANEAIKNNIEADDIAKEFLSDKRLREDFQRFMLPEIRSKLFEFWSQNNDAILLELTKLPGLKARFGGDIGPQRSNRLFERLGVYYDSIIIADPILRSITMGEPQKLKEYYVLKYSITQVLNRDVYLADVYPPIAVLLGEEYLMKETSYYPLLRTQSTFDAIAVANAIFAQNFDSEEDAKQFFKKVGTMKSLAKEVANVDMFILDDEVSKSPLEQIEAYEKERRINLDENKLPEEMKGASFMWYELLGRMLQANDVLQAATDIDAHPVIQAPRSFHWLNTKLSVNSELMSSAIEEDLLIQLPVTNALLSQRLQWLSNVPLDALIRLRKQGFLSDLRKTMAGNFSELSTVTIDNLERVSRQVDTNLQTALNRHQEQIQFLNQTLISELSVSVPTLLLSIGGTIQPLFGIMLPSWFKATSALVGTASLKDVISSTVKYVKERRQLRKSPTGILWHARRLS